MRFDLNEDEHLIRYAIVGTYMLLYCCFEHDTWAFGGYNDEGELEMNYEDGSFSIIDLLRHETLSVDMKLENVHKEIVRKAKKRIGTYFGKKRHLLIGVESYHNANIFLLHPDKTEYNMVKYKILNREGKVDSFLIPTYAHK